MKNRKVYIFSALSFLLGVFCVNYFKGCAGGGGSVKIDGKKYEVIKTITDTKYIKKDTIIYRAGKNIKKDTVIYVTIDKPVDTARIISDFYTISVYKDTLGLDSGYVYITDSISQNKILGRKYVASVYSKSISEKIYVKEKLKTTFFWGVGAGGGKGIYEANVNLFMETPSRRLYGIGAGVVNGTPILKGNILIKL